MKIKIIGEKEINLITKIIKNLDFSSPNVLYSKKMKCEDEDADFEEDILCGCDYNNYDLDVRSFKKKAYITYDDEKK